jgi:hypothetical protein
MRQRGGGWLTASTTMAKTVVCMSSPTTTGKMRAVWLCVQIQPRHSMKGLACSLASLQRSAKSAFAWVRRASSSRAGVSIPNTRPSWRRNRSSMNVSAERYWSIGRLAISCTYCGYLPAEWMSTGKSCWRVVSSGGVVAVR